LEPESISWIGDGNYAVEFRGSSGSRLGVFLNGVEIEGSPYPVYMAPSDGAVGVIVAIVIVVVVAVCLIIYIAYKRHQIAKLKREWERKVFFSPFSCASLSKANRFRFLLRKRSLTRNIRPLKDPLFLSLP